MALVSGRYASWPDAEGVCAMDDIRLMAGNLAGICCEAPAAVRYPGGIGRRQRMPLGTRRHHRSNRNRTRLDAVLPQPSIAS